MKQLLSTIMALLLTVTVMVAQRTVTGAVTDDSGEPIIGATVVVKGSSPMIGTSTDFDGNYSIKVPEGFDALVFSYTGYSSQDITLGASNVQNVTLSEGVDLEGVVVTALGVSRKEKSLGYSTSQVDGSQIAGSGEVNAVQGLAGKTSGVQVIGSGGTPGASSKILIRGNSTFTGNNQPLFVVDGMPYDNQTQSTVAGDYPFNSGLSGVNNSNRAVDINPDDIQDIRILKGPAAAALYGTRAANGVILITTKRGSNAKKGLSVSISSNVSFDQVNKLPELQSSYAQGLGGGTVSSLGVINDEGAYITNGLNGSAGTPNSWGPRIGGDPLYAEAYDNLGAYFQTGTTFNNNLSISGGSGYNTFRLSYGNTSQTGIVPNTKLNRNSLRLNAQTGTDKLRISGSANFTSTTGTKAQNGSNLSGVMLALTRMPASFDILGGDGPNGYDNPDGSSYTYISAYDNPLWSANNNPFTDNVNRFTGVAQVDYAPFEWLSFTYRLGADNFSDQRKQVFAIGANDPPAPVGEIWENFKRRTEINSDFFITAQKDFTEKFSGSLTLGNNLSHRFDKDVYTRGRNLTIPGFYNLSNASELYASEGSVTKRLAGLFFQANASYGGFIYLEVAGRNDYASTFGAKRRKSGFFYPAASMAFVFSEFIPQNNILSFGKLRLSYAQSGIEPAAYSSNTYFGQPFFTDGFTDGLGFPYLGSNGFGYTGALGNPNLEPEILTGIEAGIDLRFFNGRLGLDLTYYNQKSSNLLVDRPIAGSSGFTSVVDNIGEMVNHGLEIEAKASIIKTKNFTWDFNANFTRNVNEVLSLPDGVDEIDIEAAFASIGSYAIVGQPYGALYATKWVRDGNGSLIINPATGLPYIDSERGNVGNPFPDWTAGIGNTFSFYGVSIYGLLDIRKGGDIWAGTNARLNNIGRSLASADRDRLYVIEGVLATGVDENGRPTSNGTANNIAVAPRTYFSNFVGDAGSATEQAVVDGSWVRLRELTVSYTLPAKSVPLLENATIYFTGRNLWLSTKYPGVDPETSLTGAGSNVSGFDYFNMPGTRSFILGLRANF